jgi:sugar (pentulose or hexulose) kinase
VPGHTIVIDVGKSVAKSSLWSGDGRCVGRVSRANARVSGPDYRALDALGIEDWLARELARFADHAPIARIISVAHGAAVAMVREPFVLLRPMDYEQPIPAAVRARYVRERDAFEETGSPLLPDGLNLGAQLFWMEELYPEAISHNTQLLTWAQYWSWRFSGVAATEVTSLGCHTDLWSPRRAEPSNLAKRRGWAAALAPRRRADADLGPVTVEWVLRAHLPAVARVHCGLHDSNAALVACRGFDLFAQGDFTVLSTGTWFIAMRSAPQTLVRASLPEDRDCLLNVDVDGMPVPSSRFMGGREVEVLLGNDSPPLDAIDQQSAMLAAVPQLLSQGIRITPTQTPGCGPYPHAKGGWNRRPEDAAQRAAAVALYAALMADASLELIGARDRLLVEGRFAGAELFVRALAALRPDLAVFAVPEGLDVSFGALRTLDPSLKPAGMPKRVEPLAEDLHALRAVWREEAAATREAAA